MKPENVLIDYDGYIKLADFGLAEIVKSENEYKSNAVCGTPQYICPEMIKGEGVSFEADWWSLGILIYEMLTGRTPFNGDSSQELSNAIENNDINLRNCVFSEESKDLISKLLQKDPKNRFGAEGGANQILNHPFFDILSISNIHAKKVKPPFIPKLNSKNDTKYFDEEFLDMNTNCSSTMSDEISDTEDPFWLELSQKLVKSKSRNKESDGDEISLSKTNYKTNDSSSDQIAKTNS